MNVTTISSPSHEYPQDIYLDIGEDGKYEWVFSGDGYGQLGQQKHFLNNKTRLRVQFFGDEYNTSAKVRLLKNATVTSTMMLIDGRTNVSGAHPTQSWSNLQSYSGSKVAANTSGGKIFFARESQKYFDIYDPISNSWSTSSNCKDTFVSRAHMITFAGSQVFIATTNFSSSSPYRLYSYGIFNDTWTDHGNLPAATNLAYGGLTYDQGDNLYAIQYASGTSIAFYQYSISKNTWTSKKSPLNTNCMYPTLCHLNNRVYLMNKTLDWTSSPAGRDIQFYAPNNNSWFRLSDAPLGSITKLCTDGYNIFGATNQGRILKYDVLTDTWAITGTSTSNFVGFNGGLAYSDRYFYLSRYNPVNGYHKMAGDNGSIFPYNATMDIGDNGGSPEWNDPDDFDFMEFVNDFSTELNNILASTPTSYFDAFGNDFVDITINVTSNVTGDFTIREMFINYTYKEVIDINPYTGTLLNALNELVPDVGEGNITLPIMVYSRGLGSINISNISIDYYIPELSHGRLEVINGHGSSGKILYADYMYYTFLINVTNMAGYKDIKNVTLFLNYGGENIQLYWYEATDTFSEIFDPKNLVTLDVGNSSSINDNINSWTLQFSVRFSWSYPDDMFETCAVQTMNDTNAVTFNIVENVFYLENDLELIGNLDVVGQTQGVLVDGDWTKANEQITWSNLTAVYEGATDIYPVDKNFNITITHNGSGSWVNTTSSGGPFTTQTQTTAFSNFENMHHIDITDIPGTGQDVSNITFLIRVDADGPLAPPIIRCHSDTPGGQTPPVDDDLQVFISWNPASDAGGSGVDYYAMEFNNPLPTQMRISNTEAYGEEGNSTFYVRARDKVGNWGTVGSVSIFLDLTNLTYSNPTPSAEEWQNSRTVPCGITIQDLSGSGVKASTIQYRYVNSGDINDCSWIDYADSGINNETIDCLQNITFTSDGVDKQVQWRAKDVARNYWVVLQPVQKIKIDSIPTTIEYIQPGKDQWLTTLQPEINFLIKDTDGSGVDTTNIEYSTSTNGLVGFGPWQKVTGTITGTGVECSVKPTLKEGDSNYFQIRASDIAGNEMEFKPRQILIDVSGLTFSNPKPAPDTWSSSYNINYYITIQDMISSIDINSIKYSYSTNGVDNYNSWETLAIENIKADPDGHTFNVSVNLEVVEGINNYIRWQATDRVGNKVVSDDYRIQIDVSSIQFEDAQPTFLEWSNTKDVYCTIKLNDNGGSGILADTLEYSISTTGLKGFSGWSSQNIEIEEFNKPDHKPQNSYDQLHIGVTPDFSGGSNNYIRWRAEDLVGIIGYSEPKQINVDLDGLEFSNSEPKENKIYDDYRLQCRITIKDIGGSGVDPNSVEYRYSNTGQSGITAWTNHNITTEKFIYSVELQFNPGDQNYLQWRAMDNAGNGPIESEVFTIIINSPPVVIIDEPKDKQKFTIKDVILFNATSTYDPDEGDILTFEWRSNTSGVFGNYKDIRCTFPLGYHEITLSVMDGHGQRVNATIEIEVTKSEVDTDQDNIPDSIDDNDDNDEYPDSDDAFPTDPTEWLDTDGDGIGNNADPDDDNDGHLDSEDEYPLDASKWKNESKESESSPFILYIIIFLIVIIIIAMVAGVLRSKAKKKEAEKQAKVEAELAEKPAVMVSKRPPGLPSSTPERPLFPGTVGEPQIQTSQDALSTRMQEEMPITKTIQSYIPAPKQTPIFDQSSFTPQPQFRPQPQHEATPATSSKQSTPYTPNVPVQQPLKSVTQPPGTIPNEETKKIFTRPGLTPEQQAQIIQNKKKDPDNDFF